MCALKNIINERNCARHECSCVLKRHISAQHERYDSPSSHPFFGHPLRRWPNLALTYVMAICPLNAPLPLFWNSYAQYQLAPIQSIGANASGRHHLGRHICVTHCELLEYYGKYGDRFPFLNLRGHRPAYHTHTAHAAMARAPLAGGGARGA